MAIYKVNGESLNPVYNTGGSTLSQAYGIDGNELMSVFDTLPDSGYTFTSGGSTYNTKLLFNFGTTTFQSVVREPTTGVFYRASSDNKVYPFNSELQAQSMITLPSTGGHKNDGCCYAGSVFWLDGTADAPRAMYVWGISNNSLQLVTLPIGDNENGSLRVVAGICNADADGEMFLVSRDQYNGSDIDHQEGDVLTVFKYNVNTNEAEAVASFLWDCVYVQGATYVNGLLYVACNTQTTGSASNYTGITIKIIDPAAGQLIAEMTCSGNFEPQGCDHIILGDGTAYVWTGLSKYNTVGKVITFLV